MASGSKRPWDWNSLTWIGLALLLGAMATRIIGREYIYLQTNKELNKLPATCTLADVQAVSAVQSQRFEALNLLRIRVFWVGCGLAAPLLIAGRGKTQRNPLPDGGGQPEVTGAPGPVIKPKIMAWLVAVSVGTVPVILVLGLVDFMMVHFRLESLCIRWIFLSAPLLFPVVLAGTIISCRRSIPVRRRPLAILLGVLGTGLTGFMIAFWWVILTSGFQK